MPCKCRRELASRRHKRSACIIWPGEHHLWGDSQRLRGGRGWCRGGWWWRGERRREGQREQNNRWELSGKWKENEVQYWGGGKMMKWAGWSPQKRGNNTEAIRGNGGIIYPCYIISTDSSIMHNLHRFHNTPRALILGQLSSGCHFVGVSTRMEGKEWMFTRGPPLHLQFHLNCGWWGVLPPLRKS